MSNRASITDIPRALLEAGYESTTYHRVYNAVLAGRVPAQRGKNGRWTFEVEDLPAIAEAMGLSEAYAA